MPLLAVALVKRPILAVALVKRPTLLAVALNGDRPGTRQSAIPKSAELISVYAIVGATLVIDRWGRGIDNAAIQRI
jgi:hypothetical protein